MLYIAVQFVGQPVNAKTKLGNLQTHIMSVWCRQNNILLLAGSSVVDSNFDTFFQRFDSITLY
jgi:hypothetical protein